MAQQRPGEFVFFVVVCFQFEIYKVVGLRFLSFDFQSRSEFTEGAFTTGSIGEVPFPLWFGFAWKT